MLGIISVGDTADLKRNSRKGQKPPRGWLLPLSHRSAPAKFFGDNSGVLTPMALPAGCPQSDEIVITLSAPDYNFVMLQFPLDTGVCVQFSTIL
jgi:hypothetical protein